MAHKFNFNKINELELIYKRLADYITLTNKHLETKSKEDDEDYEFLNSGLNQIKIKSDLKKYFTILNDKDFYTILEAKSISMVFFYLPCKIVIIFNVLLEIDLNNLNYKGKENR